MDLDVTKLNTIPKYELNRKFEQLLDEEKTTACLFCLSAATGRKTTDRFLTLAWLLSDQSNPQIH